MSGCIQDGEYDDAIPPGKADADVPLGTYEPLPSADPLPELRRLVLMGDGRAHTDTTVGHGQLQAFDGKYVIGYTYIRLYDEDDNVVVYNYYVDPDDRNVLHLRKSYDEKWFKWFELSKAPTPWCREASQCPVQGATSPKCPGTWSCDLEVQRCNYQCEPDPSECFLAGGTCVAVGDPNEVCPNGVIGNADRYSCGDGVGVACCLPANLCKPVCGAGGTRSEGWFNSCSDERYCFAECEGEVAECYGDFGWYTSGNGCDGEWGLIEDVPCGE